MGGGEGQLSLTVPIRPATNLLACRTQANAIIAPDALTAPPRA